MKLMTRALLNDTFFGSHLPYMRGTSEQQGSACIIKGKNDWLTGMEQMGAVVSQDRDQCLRRRIIALDERLRYFVLVFGLRHMVKSWD